jgi:hypothetical protein
MQVATAVLRWLYRLVMPLQKPLRLDERAVLLNMRCRRQEEHLGPDIRGDQLTGLDFGAVLPEGG